MATSDVSHLLVDGPHFVDDAFPLIVSVGPLRYDPKSLARMRAGYEKYFARRERYAVITVNPKGAESPGAKERKLIAEWAGSERVRSSAAELCVGSATLARGAIERGALTAIFWLWRPSCPYHVTSSNDEALDWCIGKLSDAGLSLPGGARARQRTLALLNDL